LAISFLFLARSISIDFLRRFGESLKRWVVGDIEAAIDVKTVKNGVAFGGC
jgi:hypothetical protein